jgi:hypothetical protein
MDVLQIWVAAFFTIAIFSFLYRDNPLYKFAEHLFAGLSVGYFVGLYWQTIIVEQLWVPMTDNGQWFLIFPGLLGMLMFTRLTTKWAWLSRIALAFVVGSTAGIYLLSELHGIVLPQMQNTMLSLSGSGGLNSTILAIILVVGVITTLLFFYFSHPHTGVLGGTAKIGIWFIMISFGAHFGFTVMGRISLLIGRVYFIWNDWIGSIRTLF